MRSNPLRTARSRVALAIGAGVLVAASITTGALSLALFTDQQTVNNTFSSGSIKLNAADIAALSLTTSSMMPGDTITGAVVVQNDGDSQLRYSISTSSTNTDTKNLRSVLTLTVRTIDATTPLVPCDNFDGTLLLTATALSSNPGVGSSAQGAQAGDRNLSGGGANETLCLRVSLPGGTGNAFQGAATTTTFTFDAEQTANN